MTRRTHHWSMGILLGVLVLSAVSWGQKKTSTGENISLEDRFLRSKALLIEQFSAKKKRCESFIDASQKAKCRDEMFKVAAKINELDILHAQYSYHSIDSAAMASGMTKIIKLPPSVAKAKSADSKASLKQ